MSRLLLGLTILAVSATTATAASKIGTISSTVGKYQSAGRTAVAAELRTAKQLLESADRDYAGHRAAAVADLTAALHDLMPQTGKAATVTGKLKGKKSGKGKTAATSATPLPQAESDARLKQAQQIFTAAAAKLPAGHPTAAAKLTHATAELTAALQVK